MSESYRYLQSTLLGVMVMLCTHSGAQTDSLFKAQDLCQQKRFSQAIPIIDKVVQDPHTKEDPASWHIRSFAYLQVYKSKGAYNTAYASLLDTSLSSAIASEKLDTKGDYKENNRAFVKAIFTIYYKIGSSLLEDSLNNEKSLVYYEKYKKAVVIYDPAMNLKEKDIEYYTVTGSVFSDQFFKHNFDPKYMEVAKSALLKVLELDPKNIKANLNLGILYYNQGATLMRQMEYDVDLNQLDVIQENAKKLFKQSLPFMTKVYELEPKDQKVLEGLRGIYYSLNEYDKSDEFNKKLEQAQQQSPK